jgi:hypothetical protein
MAQVGLLKCAVRTPATIYEFEAEVHRSEGPDEQLIEPGFYMEYAKALPDGAHHELLLTKSPAWGRVHRYVPIHIHKHPVTGQHFVCYIFRLATLEDATELFCQWCVLTAYSVYFDEDGAKIAHKHRDNFLEFMAARYGFRIVES